MNPPPTIGLIITTYNWPAALRAVLESVLRQSVMPVEVLIADDGSRDDTRHMVAAYALKSPFRLLHVWQEDRGFRAAAARNKALARSRADRVVFVDGDVVLHEEFVASHRAFARRGEYIQGSRAPLDDLLSADVLAHTDRGPRWWMRGVERKQNAIHFPPLAAFIRTRQDGRDGTRSCNLGVWRDDALRVNGFDESYEGWGREDTDFCWRLIHAGVRRRDLKFAAVEYHLRHPDLPRVAEPEHEARLALVLRERRIRATIGVDLYREGAEGAEGAERG